MTNPRPLSFDIRRLTSEDVAAYRRVRLDALRTAPQAYGMSAEEGEAKDDATVARYLDETRMFGAWEAPGTLIGVAGVFVRPGVKLCHKAVLFGVHVSPEHRRRAVGRALVTHIVAEARQLAEQLQLTVATTNDAAVALYLGLGFRECGFEQRALKVDGEYVDERLMSVSLHDR